MAALADVTPLMRQVFEVVSDVSNLDYKTVEARHHGFSAYFFLAFSILGDDRLDRIQKLEVWLVSLKPALLVYWGF